MSTEKGSLEQVIGLLEDIKELLSSVIHVDKLSGRAVVDIEGAVEVEGSVEVHEPR